jgi:protein gp37
VANLKTGIQWTDATWSPTIGCTRVSPGCDSCYAFALHDQRHAAYLAGRFPGAPPQYHRPFSEVQLLPQRLSLPLRWREPRRVFVDSMSDLFHAKVPDDYLYRVFAVMAMANRHTFQVLTKRPQRMMRFMADETAAILISHHARTLAAEHGLGEYWIDNADPNLFPYGNIWLGTSVEDQAAAYRIDWLVKTPAAVRFLSCEPLLGPLDLSRWLWNRDPCTPGLDDGCPDSTRDLIHWVICGAESGRNARPMDTDWARSLRDQCLDARVPFFLKQFAKNGKKIGTPELDGVQWVQMPSV